MMWSIIIYSISLVILGLLLVIWLGVLISHFEVVSSVGKRVIHMLGGNRDPSGGPGDDIEMDDVEIHENNAEQRLLEDNENHGSVESVDHHLDLSARDGVDHVSEIHEEEPHDTEDNLDLSVTDGVDHSSDIHEEEPHDTEDNQRLSQGRDESTQSVKGSSLQVGSGGDTDQTDLKKLGLDTTMDRPANTSDEQSDQRGVTTQQSNYSNACTNVPGHQAIDQGARTLSRPDLESALRNVPELQGMSSYCGSENLYPYGMQCSGYVLSVQNIQEQSDFDSDVGQAMQSQ